MENKQNGFRNRVFWVLVMAIGVPIFFLDYSQLVDPCLMIYGSTSVLSFICAMMFLIWMLQKGAATSVYKWVAFLLFATSYNQAIQFYARWIFVYRHWDSDAFLTSFWWSYRTVPLELSMVFLLSFAIWQRWGHGVNYVDGLREEMIVGFASLEARVVDGEVRFIRHSHEGLVLDAKIVLKSDKGNDKPSKLP